uniref:G protein-coupled receptor n=1 Tax=Steinernema glaseri TaxID=37863 RepID=A0A1I7Y527_9BILA
MSLASSTAMYVAAVICSVFAALLNARLLIRFFLYRGREKTHFSLLFRAIFLYIFFNISSISYATLCLTGSFTTKWNPAAVFWSGNATFSSAFAIVASNCCISFDRIVAMRRPIAYSLRYFRFCQAVSMAFMLLCFLAAFVRHSTGFSDPHGPLPAFSVVMDLTVLREVALVKTIVCCVNVALTVVFMAETRRFLKHLQNTHIHRNITSANHIVMLQVAAEALLMILPDVIVLPLSFVGISLPTLLGPFMVPLCSAYTLVCALLMTFKLRSNTVSPAVSSSARNVS